jgi:hypothetical protein
VTVLPQAPLSRRPPRAPLPSSGTTTQSEERPGRDWHHPVEDEMPPQTAFAPGRPGGNERGPDVPAAGRGGLVAVSVVGVVLVLVSLLPLLIRWHYGRPAVRGVTPQGGTPSAGVKQRCVTCGKWIRVRGGRPRLKFLCPGCGTVQRVEGHPTGRVVSS